jgi:Protein of unknown function DUF262
MAAADQLDLEPPYQRRSVWSDGYRRFFIDSILHDYPAPAIYLQVETTPGAPTVYHVLDGKQRLLALIGFSRDEFHTGTYLADEGLGQTYFSQFPGEFQQRFSEYTLSVENITQATEEEVREAFDRLNRNVARLMPQELRNAQWEGIFIKRMESLSEAPFWSEVGVASRANVRRMRDIEFVSELFLLTMHGVLDGKSSILDDYYGLYDEGIPDEEEHRARFEAVLAYLASLPLDWRHSRFRNLADLYGLWGAVAKLSDDNALPDPAEATTRLEDFAQRVNAAVERITAGNLDGFDDAVALQYANAVRQGQGKDTNRQDRLDILQGVLQN